MISAELAAQQAAYWARPFAVRWCDSHFSVTEKFLTLEGAYEYIQKMWALIRKQVSERQFCGSQLWQSYLETPAERVKLSYVLMCDDVDSYGYSRRVDPRDLPPPTNHVSPKAEDKGLEEAFDSAFEAAVRMRITARYRHINREALVAAEKCINELLNGGFSGNGCIPLHYKLTRDSAEAALSLLRLAIQNDDQS